MENGKVKATIIKCVAAALCTAIVAYSGILNTDKLCKNKIEVSTGSSQRSSDSGLSSDDEFEAQFSDMSDDTTSEEDTTDGEADSDSAFSDAASSADTSFSSSSGTSAGSGSSSAGKSSGTASKKKITLTGGLSSTNKEEVLEYYKLVSKKNANLLFTKTLTLVSMNGGKNISQKMIDIFTPIAQKALAKNTINDEPYPGKPDKILPSDWQAAKAVNDGTYTTVYVKVVPQTDGYNGSEYEGTTGRSMGVLDGIDRALQDMGAVTVDFSKTKMTIEYQNPTIKLKVKNSTGELVKGGCEWGYSTHPYIETMDAKVLAINIHLEGAGGYINYSVKY